MTEADYIPVAEAVAESLDVPNTPQTKPLPEGAQGTQTRAWYNYHYPGKTTSSDALFELKICQGQVAVTKDEKTGAVIWKLNLHVSDKADQAGCAQIDQGRFRNIGKHKAALKMFNFDPRNPGDIRTIIFSPRDDNGQLTGGDPIMSLKINDKSKFKSMIDMEGNTVDLDFKELKGMTLQCSVIFHLRDDYKGSAGPLPSPQIFVRSCLVLGMSQKGEVNHSKSSQVQQFLAQNPDMLDAIAAQIEELKAQQALKAQTQSQAHSLLSPAPQVSQTPPNGMAGPMTMGGQGMAQPGQGMGQGQLPQLPNMAQSQMPQLPNMPHVSYGQTGLPGQMAQPGMGQSMAYPGMGQSMAYPGMGQNMSYPGMGQTMPGMAPGQPLSASQAPLDLTAHISGGMPSTGGQPGYNQPVLRPL